jgi:nucleoside-diphosphate-sugar epimerase
VSTAFVTGGSGFVGRALIGELRARGQEVRALARSEAAKKAVREAGAEPVAGDLDDAAALREGMAGCDVVYHSAAYVKQWGPREDFFRVNVAGTQTALEQARAAGVKTFVHVSTEAVLAGERPIINADETAPLAEHPAGLYPLTKGLAEEAVLAANSPALKTVIVRPRFIWGKGDTTVLPVLVESVNSGVFRWMDGGRHLTSTCHVRNVCEGMILAAERGRGGNIYFLTDGPPVVLREFLSALLETRGVKPPEGSVPSWLVRGLARALEAMWEPLGIEMDPPITYTAVKLMGEEVTVNDAKARRELGYVGRVTREEGLRELASESKSQPAEPT